MEVVATFNCDPYKQVHKMATLQDCDNTPIKDESLNVEGVNLG